MLKQRILTAVLLLAVLLPAVFYTRQEPFLLIAAALVSAAAWEWARMNGLQAESALGFGGVMGAACMAVWSSGLLAVTLTPLWMAMGVIWVLGGAWLLRGGVGAWQGLPKGLRLFLGFSTLTAAWIAVAQARFQGIHFLFSVLALVWAADVFAYAFGRMCGNRWFNAKLAPAISPGKTWEGALGGLLGVILLAGVSIWADGAALTDSRGLYTQLLQRGWVFLVISLFFLTCMSVVGDLLESLIKRSAGVKDSSGLLPGHGGVLDRIDALLPIAPLALLLVNI